MSSSDRRTLLIAAAAWATGLAGCGFTPVYGPQGSAEGLRGLIEIDDPRDAFGFTLVRQLEQRLGIPSTPEYRLAARIQVGESRQGITGGEEITRVSIRGRVNYTLRNLSSGRVVNNGVVETFTSYSTTATPFATQTAERDAEERLMTILADMIVARLLATAESWRR